jgi:hypothetical protein
MYSNVSSVAPPSGACTRFCGDWLDCNGRSHGIACFELRSDFRFGLAFPFFRLGEPKETSGRIAHCELANFASNLRHCTRSFIVTS